MIDFHQTDVARKKKLFFPLIMPVVNFSRIESHKEV